MAYISAWTDNFLRALEREFGKRVYFAGLQGSRGRGEESENSDIDVVVILDKLSASDIGIYNTMLDTLEHRHLICGFLSGKDEILNWEPSDLFQFYYDTTPIKGSLDELLPLIDEGAVSRAIKIGVCNIYHGCVHNMLHEKSDDILKSLYKAACFTVQAVCFKQTGKHVRRHSDLIDIVPRDERIIVKTYIDLKNGGKVDFKEMSETLFSWAQQLIAKTK